MKGAIFQGVTPNLTGSMCRTPVGVQGAKSPIFFCFFVTGSLVLSCKVGTRDADEGRSRGFNDEARSIK